MKSGQSIAEILKSLENESHFRNRIVHREVLEEKPPEYGSLQENFPSNIKRYLQDQNIKLYTHQTQTVELIRKGKNVIIDTPTASGKTLAFNLPIQERLMADDSARALFLYPTKALSNDQLKFLKKFERKTGIHANPAVYDGDTPQNRRPVIRKKSRIIISNPYELHQVLPWHYKWEKFFSNLEFVVLDEAHRYRGVFGSNVALLIERFKRICSLYGSSPQWVISTATLANPLEFGKKLTGMDFELVEKDGSPHGKKYFLFYNPYYEGKGETSTHYETQELFSYFVERGLQTLCFTRSRKMAEAIARWTEERLEEREPSIASRITSYRAGYLPSERREIESRLKNRDLLGVVSTNALELGIDIGSLDAVIMSGYPGTVISTWQQSGRAGRGRDESIAVLIAFQDPMNQYFMHNPEDFFGRSHENAIIDRTNPHILSGQVLCATSEYPFKLKRDSEYFGEESGEILEALHSENLVSKTPNGWVYSGKKRPAEIVSLDNISSDIFKLVCNGVVLETMDLLQVYREAHKGAVLLHQGRTYIVREIDFENNTVFLDREDVDYYTRPLDISTVEIREEVKSRNIGFFKLHFGSVKVSEEYHSYRVMKYGETLSIHSLDLPPYSFETMSLWITLPLSLKEGIWEDMHAEDYIKEQIKKKGKDAVKDYVFHGGLHGIEHGMIGTMPFVVMCDREDIGGISGIYHRDTNLPTIFIYDSFEGGIGLTEKAYDSFDEIVRITEKLIRNCPCEEGCPGCIYSPKCGNQNEPLDKKSAMMILRQMLKSISN